MSSLSFCLRDSARSAPYTFGTQFNGILQSTLPVRSVHSGRLIGCIKMMDVCYHRTDSLTTPYLKFFTEKCVEMRFIMKKCRKPRGAPVFAGGVRRHFAFAMGRSSCIMKKMRSSRRGQGGGGAGKDPREWNVGAAGKQGEGGTSVRRKSKARVERRCGGKANRRRNVGAAEKQEESGTSVRQESKARAGCEGAGKQGEDGTSALWESKARTGCRCGGKQTAGGMRRRGKESPGTR